ncbi:MAG: hypothetical protein U0V56_03915 [Actinomycetota bacterium]
MKALAVLAARSFANLRPSGVKVHAGAVLLGRPHRGGLRGDGGGRRRAGRRDRDQRREGPETAAEMTGWAHAHGMRVMVHTGGASIPGSGIVGADFVVAVRPDVAGHVNGGPTALPLEHVERILDETDARVEIVHNGNVKAAGEVAALVGRRGEAHRLVVGTDSPAGSGAQPLGMLRTVAWAAAFGGLDPAVAVAAATGTSPRCTAWTPVCSRWAARPTCWSSTRRSARRRPTRWERWRSGTRPPSRWPRPTARSGSRRAATPRRRCGPS